MLKKSSGEILFETVPRAEPLVARHHPLFAPNDVIVRIVVEDKYRRRELTQILVGVTQIADHSKERRSISCLHVSRIVGARWDRGHQCKPRFEDAYIDTLLNPMVIVEVLSESTEAYDRGEKFAHYRRLDTLREYVLVAQDKIRIEHYLREGEQWILSEISDSDGTLHLVSIDCHVGVAAIYEKVEFTPLPAHP